MIKDIIGISVGIGLLILGFSMPGISILVLAIVGVGAFLTGRSIKNIIQNL